MDDTYTGFVVSHVPESLDDTIPMYLFREYANGDTKKKGFV